MAERKSSIPDKLFRRFVQLMYGYQPDDQEFQQIRRDFESTVPDQHAQPESVPHLEEIAALYRATGNPAYAWEALDECLKHGSSLPRWIREYLAVSSQCILSDMYNARDEAENVTERTPGHLGLTPKIVRDFWGDGLSASMAAQYEAAQKAGRDLLDGLSDHGVQSKHRVRPGRIRLTVSRRSVEGMIAKARRLWREQE